MDSRGTTPRNWTQLSDLTEIFNHRGPFITAHLPTPGDVEQASQQNSTNWETQRQRLADQGVAEDALLNVDDLIAAAHENARSIFVIAGEKEVYHASYWNNPLLRNFAEFSALPQLTPLIDLRQGTCNYVTVVADRTGADIHGYTQEGKEVEVAHAGGETSYIQKVQVGGWSHLRYQHRAEATWEHNAKAVVEQLQETIEKVRPRMVFLAGEVRAIEKIQKELPAQLQYGATLEVVDGSRGNDGAAPISQVEIERCLARLEMEDTLAMTNKLAEEFGEHDRAAVGVAGVVSALQQTKVEVLLVQSGEPSSEMVWVGRGPEHIARTKEELEQMGVSDIIQVPIQDAAIRSALLSGATVRVVPQMEAENQHLAAILRW